MSEIKVNKITPKQNCTQVTLGDSGDTFVIPSGVTITNNGTQTGFGRTGTVDWDTTAKTSSFTAVSGNGYFVNTTSGAITVTLPAGSAGDIVSLADYAATWQTNNITVTPNGTDKIGGVNADVVLNTEGQSVTFVYVDSTQGWINTMDSTSNERGNNFLVATGGTITTCGNCKIHTFTGPGTFTVTNVASCAPQNIVSYVVVAGAAGGGGGNWHYAGGGGGGAGGYREVKNPVTPYTASPLDGYPSAPNRVTITAQAYPITVGAGGSGGSAGGLGGGGNNSVFSTITSAAGGAGAAAGSGAPDGNTVGRDGGSGGGGGGKGTPTPTNAGGSGNTPPVSPPQGNPGGTGDGVSPNAGGGGGGAGGAGTNASCSASFPVPGGAGTTTSISGSPTPFSIGGPGSECAAQIVGGNNTGDGGSGNRFAPPGCGPFVTGSNGGSGIVIIRYKYQ